ncbi:MAG: ribosome biogenesis GTPase Der [Patescibacteria group bacterium]|jgi:GTP-binding protein
MSRTPVVAIVGRTNVGKSTLFNRLVEEHKALVSNVPGTTRDRNEAEVFWRGKIFNIVDTGGTDSEFGPVIEKATHEQIWRAVEGADIVLFVVDLKTGPMPQERALAKKLKTVNKPIIVVGNKAETPNLVASVHATEWRLAGLPSPFAVSALRGTGTGDLLDLIHKALRKVKHPAVEKKKEPVTRVAIIGKPNVGKSSIVNSILGEERVITSPMAHTTREPIDTTIEVNGKKYILIDTAGMRKSGKVKQAGGLEMAGVKRTKDAVEHADVVLLVLEANEQIGTQDKSIAGILDGSTAGTIIVANKWDLVLNKTPSTINDYERYVNGMMPFIAYAPIVFTSAKTGQRIENIFTLIDQVQAARHREISEEDLEKFFRRMIAHRSPIRGKVVKPPKALGLRQTGTCPPSFAVTIKAKREDAISQSYLRYIENRLHEEFDFNGTPVVVRARLPRITAS